MSSSISPRVLFDQWYAQIWATEYVAGVEGTLCKLFEMLCGHTGPLLGLLWHLDQRMASQHPLLA